MKWLMLFLAIPMLCSAAAKQLTADELKQILEKKDVLFLDVREPKELVEFGTIKGYVNVPVGEIENRLSEIPKDKLIVTGCLRGVRAARAADILEKHGYKVVGACGLTEWKSKNYPLVPPNQPKQ